MIKIDSTARTKSRFTDAAHIKTAFIKTVIGLACVAAAGMSVTGCAATSGTSPNASGPGAASSSAAANAPSPSAAASVAASNAPSSPAAAAPSANGTATGTARCHTQDLSASFTVVNGSAGAGSISYNLRLTNKSGHLCTIYGFPGMLLLDAKHRPLPTNVVWDSLVPKRLVWLIPGASASSTVRFSPDVPGTGDNGTAAPGQPWTCEPTAYYVEITPPDETTQLVTSVAPATPVCERGTMQTSALIAGGTGPNQ